jgi:hypothetical protein
MKGGLVEMEAREGRNLISHFCITELPCYLRALGGFRLGVVSSAVLSSCTDA